MTEWFYLWRYGLTDAWIYAGYFYGNRHQAQMLAGGMAYGWRITDSSNYEVFPPEAPTFTANVQLPTAQALGVEQYGWFK